MKKHNNLLAILILGVFIVFVVLAVYRVKNPAETELTDDMRLFIERQIRQKFRIDDPDVKYSTSAIHVMDAKKFSTNTTVYLWLVYRDYGYDGKPVEKTNVITPAAITIARENMAFDWKLISFKMPRSDGNYDNDVNDIFPKDLQAEALHAPDYVKQLEQQCTNDAEAHFKK